MRALALGQIELIAAYVVLAVILLSILLWARIRWWIKAAAILLTVGFFFVGHESLRHLAGWPTDQTPPDRFELVYAVVIEPNERRQDPGAIYVWVLELPGEGPVAEEDVYTPGAIDVRLEPGQAPRAYRLPYSRVAHEEVYEARVKVLQGVRQIGVSTRNPKKPGEYAPQSLFAFYDRPDPILPPKDLPPGYTP